MVVRQPKSVLSPAPPGPGRRPPFVRTALLAAAVAAAGFLAYRGSLDAVFVMDDVDDIPNNRHIRTLWPLSEALSLPEWNTGLTVARRPLLSLSLAVNYALTGPGARGFHAGNILIHLTAALLLLALLRRTLRLPDMPPTISRAADPLALAAAGLWAVHPLTTMAVTYAVQRAEALMAVFFLLTLYCFVRGLSAPKHPARWHAAAVAACWLALGAKEVAVVIPLAVLLFDRQFGAGSFLQALRRRWGMYAGLAAVWAVEFWMLKQWPGRTFEDPAQWPVWIYAIYQPLAILRYVGQAFWPANLVFLYEWPATVSAWEPAACGVVAAMLGAVVWGLFRRKTWALLAALFFLILAPSSSVILNFQSAQEHRVYLSLAAVIVLAVTGLWGRLERLRTSGRLSARTAAVVASALALAAAIAMGLRTDRRNRDYRSEEAFWRSNVEARPESIIGHTSLATALAAKGQFDKALEQYEIALELAPKDRLGGRAASLCWLYLQLAKCHIERSEAPEAAACLARARDALEEARGQIRQAYERENIEGLRLDLAQVALVADLQASRFEQAAQNARALQDAGRGAQARAVCQRAIQLYPRSIPCRRILGLLLLETDARAAVACFRQVVQMAPGNAQSHADLGFALLQAGDSPGGVEEYRRAVALAPANARFQAELSAALARAGPGASSASRPHP